MSVSPVNNTASSTATSTTSALSGATGTLATQDQFLKLLIAQLQNQDPMNPMDNSQITSQMAQISTVSGINSLNTSLSTLTSNLSASQSLQASNLIGHTVLAPSSNILLSNSQAIGGVDLSGNADSVTVAIEDATGNVVQKVNLGAQSAGVVPFTWDGTDNSGNTLADGLYKLVVTATQGGQAVTANSLAAGQVQSVALGSSGVNLSLNQLGSVPASSIKQIF